MVKHITPELKEFYETTCNDILDELVNENKLIKKKYAKKDTFSLPSTNNKTESDLQAELMVEKEFVFSEVCLLKKEAHTLYVSKYVSVGNSKSPDPPSIVGNECLLEKLEKENRFSRENFQNKNIFIKTLITDLNKKINTQSFSYNQYVTEK